MGARQRFSYPHLFTISTVQHPVSMQFSNRLWQTRCVPQWARACEHVDRCWAAAAPQDMASNGAASMPTRAVATTNRAMISSPRGAVRQQILRRDCEAGQWPVAGSAVSMPSFLRVQSGRRARGDLNFTIASDLGRNVTRDRFRAPIVAESARIALPYRITIRQNRGDTSAHTHTREPRTYHGRGFSLCPGETPLDPPNAPPPLRVRLSAAPTRNPAMVDVDQMRRAGKMRRSRVEHQKWGAHQQQRR